MCAAVVFVCVMWCASCLSRSIGRANTSLPAFIAGELRWLPHGTQRVRAPHSVSKEGTQDQYRLTGGVAGSQGSRRSQGKPLSDSVTTRRRGREREEQLSPSCPLLDRRGGREVTGVLTRCSWVVVLAHSAQVDQCRDIAGCVAQRVCA
jgi:hypothetical protein